jgi:hypothetical protein
MQQQGDIYERSIEADEKAPQQLNHSRSSAPAVMRIRILVCVSNPSVAASLRPDPIQEDQTRRHGGQARCGGVRVGAQQGQQGASRHERHAGALGFARV